MPAPVPSVGEPLGVGSKSVMDSGAVSGVPQPVVSLPPTNMGPPPRPPKTPQWQVPQAPQPINPGRGNAQEALQGGIAYNAFTPYESSCRAGQAPGTPEQGMLGNAFSSDLDPVRPASHPVAYGPPAAGVFGPPLGPPPGPPQPMMASYGQPRMNPMPSRSAPYGPTVQLTPPAGASRGAPQGTQVAMLPPPQDRGVMSVGYQAPAASAPAAATTVPQLTNVLHDALFPSQREMAAENLATFDCMANDDAVRALIQAVREDPAATVRATCIQALAKMKANTVPVISALQAAKDDSDGRVRHEAEDALNVLTAVK